MTFHQLFLLAVMVIVSHNIHSQKEQLQEIEFGQNPGNLKALIYASASSQKLETK